MADYKISSGLERLADKIAKAKDPSRIERAVTQTTLEAQEDLVQRITTEIEPHSGLSRKRNPQAEVTDLVDTGAYRASWTVSFPEPLVGVLSTNSKYAPYLEYGTEHSPAFYPARDTARKLAAVFKTRMTDAIKDAYK